MDKAKQRDEYVHHLTEKIKTVKSEIESAESQKEFFTYKESYGRQELVFLESELKNFNKFLDSQEEVQAEVAD